MLKKDEKKINKVDKEGYRWSNRYIFVKGKI